MADIEQKLQEIQQQKERLDTAKQNLKTAITGKGVTVPDSTKLDQYYILVNDIQQGGGESIDLSFVTATEDKILTGYVGADKDGGQVHGSMPIAQVTETDSKVTVSKGYLSETKEFTVSGGSGNTVNTAGVLIDDNGTLKVQKLSFDGTVASDSGEPVSADKFYMFNTGKDEPDYGDSGQPAGSAMEIYKCASVDSVNNTWSGYLYNRETKNFSETLTEGLKYKMAAPIVEKVYTADGTIECDVEIQRGLIFYAPLKNADNSIEASDIYTVSTPVYKVIDGIDALYSGIYRIKCPDFGRARNAGKFSLSYMVKGDAGRALVCLGSASSNSVAMNYEKSFAIGRSLFAVDTSVVGIYSDINSWQHIVITFYNNNVTVYVNGSKTKEAVYPSATQTFDENSTYVWLRGTPTGWNYTGTTAGETLQDGVCLAEMCIYNRVLSADEIKAEADRCLAMVTE